MTGRIGDRLERVERAVRVAPRHVVVCYDMAEVAEAKRLISSSTFLNSRSHTQASVSYAAAPESLIRNVCRTQFQPTKLLLCISLAVDINLSAQS